MARNRTVPPEGRVEAEGARTARQVPGAQEVTGVPDGECAVAGAHQRLGGRRRRACVESPAARLIVVSEAAGARESVHADILARAHRYWGWRRVEGLLDQVGRFGDLVIAGAVIGPLPLLTRETYTLDHRRAAAQSDDA